MKNDEDNRFLIVGGEEVPDASLVYPAFVWSGIASDGWGCGGALIHSDIIISAAHCAVSFVDNERNYIGPTWITGENATFFASKRTLVHPEYDWGQKANDILLTQLDGHSTAKVFEYNKDDSIPEVNSSVSIIGFGFVTEHGPFSDVLKKVDVQIFPFDVCLQTYSDSPFTLKEETHICAGTWEGGKDGCASDSGSPLFVDNTVLAITEDGIGCGRPGVPAYYTRVNNEAQWITEAICLMSSRPPKHCKKMNISWSLAPTPAPTVSPTSPPTATPTKPPTMAPTISRSPTNAPTAWPTRFRTTAPTHAPTHAPVPSPSLVMLKARTVLIFLVVTVLVGYCVAHLWSWIARLRRRETYDKIAHPATVSLSDDSELSSS